VSTRQRSRPWWRDPLPPFEQTELGRRIGGDSISFRVKLEPRCANCGGTIQNHYIMRMDHWYSPLLCKTGDGTWKRAKW
jgi:hypothetical protein